MKKILSIIGVVILVLVVVLVLFLGSIIKGAINTAGPQVLGVDVVVEKVGVNPLTGTVHVKGLMIGNPEGFKTPSAMELGEFKLKMSLASLFTDTIVIHQILIDAPQITYEMKSLTTSNLSELQKNLTPAQTGEEEVVEEAPKDGKPAKKVVIEDFQLTNGKVNITAVMFGGKKFSVPLPDIKKQDIGKASDGASPVEVAKELFGSIKDGVVKAASSVVGLGGDALKGAGEMAGNLAGDATGAAKDAAGAATGAAKDAAKGATDALKKGIGGLFGGDE
jgi:hypothetical protein